jgi:hypothetical protein
MELDPVNGDEWAQMSLRPDVAGGHPIGTRAHSAIEAPRA